MVAVFSRLLPLLQCSRSYTLYTSVRSFSRSYRPKFSVKKQGENVVGKEVASKFKEVKVWRQVAKQCIFTSAFLGVVYAVNIGHELAEAKYSNHNEHGRFIFDIMDDFWGSLCGHLNCQDTMFNRRILQVSGLLVACFICSIPLFLARPRLMLLLGSSPTSSFVSPITSMFMHGSIIHLACNVLCLFVITVGWNSSGPPIYNSLQDMTHQHILAFLIAAGGVTSVVCCIRSAVFGLASVSVGFSGALSALVMYEITQKPESRVALVFLDPKRYNWSAQEIGVFVIAFEVLLLLTSNFHRIDAFGHLAGLGFGYFYSKTGHDLWKKGKSHLNPVI